MILNRIDWNDEKKRQIVEGNKMKQSKWIGMNIWVYDVQICCMIYFCLFICICINYENADEIRSINIRGMKMITVSFFHSHDPLQVHTAVCGVRDGKAGWLDLYCPSGPACDDEGQLFSLMVRVAFHLILGFPT